MSEIKKLDRLIARVINEELNELDTSSKTNYVNANDPKAVEIATQKLKRKEIQNFTAIKERKNTEKKEKLHDSEDVDGESEEKGETPKAADMIGKVSEVIDKLNAVSEKAENPKVMRMSEKAKSQLDAAKMTLEAIASHEAMMEEKEVEKKKKVAETTLQKIAKALKKIIKSDELVAKVMKKFPLQSAIEMLDRQRGINPEVEPDHSKVAEALAKVALNEGIIRRGKI